VTSDALYAGFERGDVVCLGRERRSGCEARHLCGGVIAYGTGHRHALRRGQLEGAGGEGVDLNRAVESHCEDDAAGDVQDAIGGRKRQRQGRGAIGLGGEGPGFERGQRLTFRTGDVCGEARGVDSGIG